MKMASSAEYDYNCPMCCDIFKTPVILLCSHSVCKECLQQFWRTKKTQECPVCRRRSSKDQPLENLNKTFFLKERNDSCSSGSEEICSLQGEKLKLFCLDDKQPACVVCRDSKQHDNHKFRPISEVVSSYKVGIAPCHFAQLNFFTLLWKKYLPTTIPPPPPILVSSGISILFFFCMKKTLNSVILNCSSPPWEL